MIRVLYVYMTLPIGGAEELMLTVVKNIDRSKYEPVVCCIGTLGKIGEEIRALGIDVVSWGHTTHGFDLAACRSLYRLIREKHIDLVHSHLYHAGIYSRIAAGFAGVPAITTEHNVYATFKLKRRIYNWLLSWKTARIVAVSDLVRDYVIRRDWVSPQKVTTIRNGLDLSKWANAPGRQEARERLGIPGDAFVLGCIGRLETQKGHRFLIDAVARLRGEIPGLKAFIVGEGTLRDSLAERIRRRGLQDAVVLTGARRDLADFIHAFDLFVLPSRWEGLPIAALEAMASRLPVIATPVGGVVELIEEGKNGLLVPPKDVDALVNAIRKLHDDAPLRAALAAGGQETVREKFSATAMLAEMDALYRKVLPKN
ncbi:MAG: glycosyltransferase [Chthoniobacteraceae bacterium]